MWNNINTPTSIDLLFVVVHVSWDDVGISFHIALFLIVDVGISGVDCILLRNWACLLRFK